jgi:DNA-binding beta-propeller fold protein YncE
MSTYKSLYLAAIVTIVLAGATLLPGADSIDGFMYVGSLDQKLLVINEADGEVVAEIPLGGIPRTTVSAAEPSQLHIVTTQLQFETVDLAARKVTRSFSLSDGRSSPRLVRSGGRTFSGLAVDPGGRYVYATMEAAIKEIDHFRIEPPVFVTIDLEEQRISKSTPFPKGYDQGFGFAATYKLSPDGQKLYVFDDDIVVFDVAALKELDRIPLAKPPYPGASPYRLTASDDPNDSPGIVTSVFTSTDPIVHKETLGLATLDLATGTVDYRPFGPAFPMVGFALSPDRKVGYSLMITRAGANRETEWWVWDIDSAKVIRRAPVPARPNFRFGVSSDGSKLFVYGSGSTIEFYDAETLKAIKMLYLNKDTTTNLITLPGKAKS